MDSNQDYDRKFEEMKMYIPFLESMIKRLESTGVRSGNNPRQAQLDKIRSLRDLLLDKKKRMKMQNLLKCEQVLVNLYVKVEQRDTKLKLAPTSTEKSTADFNTVRNKLKSVANRMDETTDTLPEIARAHDLDVSTSGSKEPALFQRRPNKLSKSPISSPVADKKSSSPQSLSKRNYTRVLLSPDPSERRWDKSSTIIDKPLFSRRSPRRSPKRYSPTYNKKERKKMAKRSNIDSKKERKDWNITLNVPEESLNSLNTKDILSRIINCSDGDVDIDTLRELRTQILGELKQTGASDDISDLILKSYKKKKDTSVTRSSKEEVEEGELSDSESEAIESIYSSLVVVDQNESSVSEEKTSLEKDQPRKIQICLVINADKDDDSKSCNENNLKDQKTVDISDFEMFSGTTGEKNTAISVHKKSDKSPVANDKNELAEKKETIIEEVVVVQSKPENRNETIVYGENSSQDQESQGTLDTDDRSNEIISEPRKFKANFYKPLIEQGGETKDSSVDTSDKPKVDNSMVETSVVREITVLEPSDSKNDSYEQENKDVEIPLLNDRPIPTEPPTVQNPTVSEIEILQALKNDILSETIPLSGSEMATPALHLPKILKVANAKEILPKKRISIENYKQKSVSTKSRHSLYFNDDPLLDQNKKTSLKLTEKECERFNLTKLAMDDDDNSEDYDLATDDIYGDLAPKSPDNEEPAQLPTASPVIIPVDQVKVTNDITKLDVDMRTLLPMVSPKATTAHTVSSPIESLSIKDKFDAIKSEPNKIDRSPLTDPRMRRDIDISLNLDTYPAPRPTQVPGFSTAAPSMSAIMSPNITPIMNPSVMPDLNPSLMPTLNPTMMPGFNPAMTPNSRTFEMTPSHQSLDIDSNNKHVYAPVFSAFESREPREIRGPSVVNDLRRDKTDNLSENQRYRQNSGTRWDDPRSSSVQRDIEGQKSRYGNPYKHKKAVNERYRIDRRNNRSECSPTPHSFNRYDSVNPSFGSKDATSSHPFGRLDLRDCPNTPSPSFGRSDCPSTPNHPFGRSDCPATPGHPFGRSDCPATPSHPFGRSDCPATPSHPFGRSECPTTPSHSFGRSECPSTPIHPFGRNDMTMTPSHPYGRSDSSQSHSHNTFYKDPRINRPSDYENTYKDIDSEYYKDNSFDHVNSYRIKNRSYHKPDYRYDRERDHNSRYNSREAMYRREQMNTHDYEDERRRSRSGGHYRNENVKSFDDVGTRRHLQRERSIGRNMPDNRFGTSKVRATSVGRNLLPEPEGDNMLSVNRDAGRSFTINTSVNATFQDVLAAGNEIQKSDCSFDARRQRAASVGRSLTRESSTGSPLFHSKSKNAQQAFGDNNRESGSRRACSVGRELSSSNVNQTLNEIKADFETYSKSIKMPFSSERKIQERGNQESNEATDQYLRKRNINNAHGNTETDIKPPYSPRKNYRDPRMRREMYNDHKRRDNKYNKDWRDHKKHGIVYSNDNIAKGTILGSGYGVRNYKIPKIKRSVEEKVEEKEKVKLKEEIEITDVIEKKDTEIVPEELDKNVDGSKSKKTDSISRKGSKATIKDDLPEKRVTRSKKLSTSEAFETKNVMNLRKNRKAIIYDSESESESVIDDQHTVSEKSNTVCPSPDGKKISDEKIEADQSESLSSFCVDDLDMFPENIVSDPVLDNINALIADLDNDIDTTKNDTEVSASEFTNELTLENMLDNISSTESEEQPPKILTMDAIHETSNDNTSIAINASLNSDEEILLKTPSNNEDASSVENIVQSTEAKKEDSDKLELPKKVSGNEDIVSTTDAEPREQIKLDVLDDKSCDGCSTPDSTINTNEAILEKAKEKEGSADSTIDNVQSEMNSDVSSTHSIESIRKEPEESHHSSHSDNIPALESFGSLLSILKNKSKIKELLGMLGQNSSGNEKIKKQLVKLSEIVFDEEDTGDEGDKDDSLNGSKEAEHSRVTEKIAYNTEQLSTEHLPSNNEHPLSNTEQPPSNTERPLNNSKQLSGNVELLPSIPNLYGKLEHPDNATIVQLDSCETSLPSTEMTAETVYDKSSLAENDNIVQPDPNTSVDIKSAENDTDDNIEKKNDNVGIANLSVPKDDTDEQKIENIVKDSALNFAENKTDVEAKDEAVESNLLENTQTEKKKPAKKPKFVKKGKGKKVKTFVQREPKRVTRLAVGNTDKTPTKKPSRELLKLQEDVKDMFKKGDALNTSGIRMCRLAKLVEDTSAKDIQNPDSEPVVILEKCKNTEKSDKVHNEKPNKKKLRPKPKPKSTIVEYENKEERPNTSNNKPGPRSKIQRKPSEVDPYEFEMDSLDTNTSKASDVDNESGSDSENESLASSIGSTEVLSDVKKKKRKRPGWKAGVIKPKKRKMDKNLDEPTLPIPVSAEHVRKPSNLPDLKCFVDKDYSFEKNIFTYSCRLCVYFGTEIVHHYKNNHPHSEVPISRLNSTVANEAIEQCEHPNFQNIMKIPTERYVCRFCSNEFGKTKSALERFFWHVVSMHTGEYKQMCSECDSAQCCPFSMDIPPPPQDETAQLLAFICGKCNFTQISLENLKTHVILRHNDEETVVYAISLSEMSKKAISDLNKPFGAAKVRRVLRSLRAQQSLSEESEHIAIAESSRKSDCPSPERKLSVAEIPKIDEKSEIEHKNIVSVQSQITFETDENNEVAGHIEPVAQSNVKTEPVEENYQAPIQFAEHTEDEDRPKNPTSTDEPIQRKTFPDGVIEYPHFKLSCSDSGTKEYVCCINGADNHYTTTLLISMKRHIQTKHTEQWDGYCFLCKVIVTPQGMHNFKDCLQHYLDKHIDDIPVLEKRNKNDGQMALAANVRPILDHDPPVGEKPSSPRSLINVRPLAELIVKDIDTASKVASPLPKIESVISLGSPRVDPTQSPMLSPAYPTTSAAKQPEKQFTKYEEAQAVVMAKKHRVVLEAMMTKEKLLQVFKCAGRYCSFTSDLVEESLLHASTHHRIGGVDSLNCSYCDFDSSGNAIDLVMHVFKVHGRCQFSCRHCFYRGAASQLVAAHMSRKHGAKAVKSPVLRTTYVSQPVGPDVAGMLTRSEAVSYFVCGHGSNGVGCPFRTFTVGKYYEHLQQRHSSAVAHPCQDCSMQFPSAIQLADHTKCHNYKLYQCAWCVHGDDKETDLLEHASIYHPGKPPQAYMRIITNKGGSLEQRVLPLVCLNKANVLTEVVNPSSSRENPVREAERSIDLEKLIGHTMLIESAEPITDPEARLVEEPINIPDAFSDIADTDSTNPSVADAPIESLLTEAPPRIVTPPPVTDSTPELTPIVKTEPELTLSVDKLNNVVCLDSDDEEDTLKTTIDLSVEDDTGTTKVHDNMKRFQKIYDQLLYKCPLCEVLFRTENNFKKHSCLTLCRTKKLITCPHCQAVMVTIMDLLKHYKNSHGSNHYICELCEKSFSTLSTTKKHIAAAHKKIKNIYCQCVGYSDGVKRYIVSKNPNIIPVNRKVSVETSVKSFGPQDVDKLPINPIMDSPVFCAVCKFNTKVRLNMVRHLQLHAEQQPAPNTAPVNPVPHLETNEMHFDRMLNLASSSLSARAASAGPAPAAPATPAAPAGDRYPKFVPDRQRYTCGARGCSYTSIDETMLRCHWEALHADCQDFVCTHCPPQQYMDRTRPLSAARIIAHLNMHDAALYGCSSCSYYHNLRKLVDKHLNDVHKGGQVVVIREDGKNVTSSQPPPAPNAAPTMDLKPWQCGLCEFKSMLRPAVVEHCTKVHHSKMQFKCAYCPFRTSAKENVTKHQQHSHPERSEEVFYYYYREGSIPDEGGVPRWRKQVQKNPDTQTEVKTEVPDVTSTPQTPLAVPHTPPPLVVDLNLVKVEVDAECEKDDTIEQLTAKYGQVCEPNGIRFKCPLCKVVSEDTPDAMQSHLYEELKYRKWSCAICAYKAFHSTGLKEHMASEHGRAAQEPIQLPPDVNIERWVAKHIEHQAAIIKSTKEKLCLQKAEVPKTTEHKAKENPQESSTSQKEISDTELINAFGPFGNPSYMMYACPKCSQLEQDPAVMRDHLETELSKIRWCCSECPASFQTYHEAQYHCRCAHPRGARPVGAARDPALRAAWLGGVLRHQAALLQAGPAPRSPDPDENSLLVVRYEVPAAGESPPRRKRPAPSTSDDDRRPDEDCPQKKKIQCLYCNYTTTYPHSLKQHTVRHYNLKPYTCPYCNVTASRLALQRHIELSHPGRPVRTVPTEVPDEPPTNISLAYKRTAKNLDEESVTKMQCLYCEKLVQENEMTAHTHEGIKPEFAKVGAVVVKCCICQQLKLDLESLQEHHSAAHAHTAVNYSYFKVKCEPREVFQCCHCSKKFVYLKDLMSHHNATHLYVSVKYLILTVSTSANSVDKAKRRSLDAAIPLRKRIAKKSTTKLPMNTVAKKSTTKLPMMTYESDSEEEYSFYGNSPTPLENYANVTTLMPFFNNMVPFTLKKLRGIIEIDPKVMVKDCFKQ